MCPNLFPNFFPKHFFIPNLLPTFVTLLINRVLCHMKKIISVIATLLVATALYAQKNVTKFLGIPVDGTKANMIQQLKAKGFQYNSVKDILTGEFNGRNVNLSVVTNNNKVYRILVKDAIGTSETDIKIRFNTLCQQFEDNKKYTSDKDFTISEVEDISYEMDINNKRYEADFYQMDFASIDTVAIQEEAIKYFSTKYTAEQIEKMNDEEKESISKEFAIDYFLESMRNRSVWFMISEEYGKYYILLFYDNGYNQANGEDL